MMVLTTFNSDILLSVFIVCQYYFMTSFDCNSVACMSQKEDNDRSYVQTIDHRALRICKKRFQKVLMLSSFFLINSSSYLLSDSYNETLFKSLHIVYVKWYWLISFGFVDRRSMKFINTNLLKCFGI